MSEGQQVHSTTEFTLVSVSPNKTESEVPALRRIRLMQQSDKESWSGLTLESLLPPLGLKASQSDHAAAKTIEYKSGMLLRDLCAELGPTEAVLNFAAPNESQLVKDAAPQNTYSKGGYLLTQDLLYRVYQTDARLVRSVLELGGFAATDSHDWNVLWANSSPKSYLYEGLNEYQRINHFPRSNEITRKDLLCANLVKMQATYGREHYDFAPDTYILPDEFADFCSEFNSDPGSIWIVKPSASSQGRGIFLVDNLVDVPLDDNCVISRYISNPLLLNSLKFDLRIYVLVTSFDPLRIYVFQEGLTRFASEAYNPNSASSRYMFLTNYSVNKRNSNFVQNETPDKDDVGHKWSLSALSKHLETVGIDISLLWGKIYDLIVKTIISMDSVVNASTRKLGLHRSNCFDLFGFDVIIDSNLKPWLLEVNLSPSLGTDSPLDLAIKGQLIADTFTLVGVKAYDRKKEGINRARSRLVNSSTLSNRKSSSMPPSAYLDRRGGNATQPTLENYSASPKFKTILKESIEEFNRRGRFIRIYPAPGSIAYNRFFPVVKTSNMCLYEALFGGGSGAQIMKSPGQAKTGRSPSRTIIRGTAKKTEAELSVNCARCGQPYPRTSSGCPNCAPPEATPTPTKIKVSSDDVLMEYISRLAHTLRSIREDALKPHWKKALERFLTHHAWLTSDQRRSGGSLLWERLEARVTEIKQRKARQNTEPQKPDPDADMKASAIRKLTSIKLERVLKTSMKNIAFDLISCLFDTEGNGMLTAIIKWLADAANRQETRILVSGEEPGSGLTLVYSGHRIIMEQPPPIEEDTIFGKIARKEIPANIVYEDEQCLAFRDITPQAPIHIVLIPKNKDGLTQLSRADERHKAILGHLMWAAAEIARREGLGESGWRLVVNDGRSANQTVFHLHLHILGGRELRWPPG